MQPPCFLASGKPADPFAGDVQDVSALDRAPVIEPAEGDVHFEIEDPEGLAAFRLAPNHNYADTRYQLVHKVGWRGVKLDVAEADEPKAHLMPARPVRLVQRLPVFKRSIGPVPCKFVKMLAHEAACDGRHPDCRARKTRVPMPMRLGGCLR